MWKNLNDRFVVTLVVFLMVFTIIVFRLTAIMIVAGEQYREEAENRIFKSIPLKAPRGEIRDRYGRLLAGNRPSFTVQIMKNEIVDEELNQVLLKIINVLEANEDRYTDDFPIVLDDEGRYIFTFDREIENWKNENEIPQSATAKEAFQLLLQRFGITSWEDDFDAQQQLLQNVGTVPISVVTMRFTEEMKKTNWLESHNLRDFDGTAEEAFIHARDNTYKIPQEYNNIDARKIMVVREQLRSQGYLQFQPVTVANDISKQSVIEIEESINELPGVNITVEPIRYYPEGKVGAHILGTLGKISQQNEIDKYVNEMGYAASAIIGKTGIEQKYEEQLNGEDGYQKVIVDSRGRLIEVLERVEPVPGQTIYLTIDLNLQIKAEEVLEEVLKTLEVGGTYETQWGKNILMSSSSGVMSNAKSASAVVQDVNNGEILALANYPTYDPNLFATGISLTDWNSLMPENEKDPIAPRPLTNIALSTAIQPGSTFKMLTGIAALEQGLDPEYEILDKGFIQIGGHSFGNWLWNSNRRTMGWQNIHQAIADSNNYYFYSVATGYDYGIGRYLPFSMNVDNIIDYSKRFGLNDRTGIEIDIPRERSGGVPSLESKTRTIKALLTNYLNRQLKAEDFDETVVEITSEKVTEIIDTILSWTEENPTRSAVYNRMMELGFKHERANFYTDVIKFTYFNQAEWSKSDTMNFAIGQGEHSYTPIQMANYMAILANGGYKYDVSVVRKIQDYDGENLTEYPPELIERIPMNDYENINEVNYGMHQVTVTGSAKSYFANFPVKTAGKTGTAQRSGKMPELDEEAYLKKHLKTFGVTEAAVEAKTLELMEDNKEDAKFLDKGYAMREAIKLLNPNIKNVDLDQFKRDYDNYAWYTGFAPYEDPEIAISVLIFQGGSGGYAAPIFREITAEYMGLNLEEEADKMFLESRLAQ